MNIIPYVFLCIFKFTKGQIKMVGRLDLVGELH